MLVNDGWGNFTVWKNPILCGERLHSYTKMALNLIVSIPSYAHVNPKHVYTLGNQDGHVSQKTHVNELCKFGFTVTEFAFSRFGSKQQKSTPVVQPLVRSKWNGPLPVRTTINQLDGKVSNMPQFSSTFCLFNERYSRPKKKCHYVIANGTTH